MGGEYGEFKKYLATPLEPGKSHTWEIDLVRFFQLTPGVYTLSVSHELNLSTYPFTVAVEDVGFEVAAAPVAAR